VIIQVNGERREVSAPLTLADLVDHLKLAADRLAIELNQRVIRRVDWQQTVLSEGDRVEIVHFVGGGLGKAIMNF
jgi:thiamine biosynthesis protein ThiS